MTSTATLGFDPSDKVVVRWRGQYAAPGSSLRYEVAIHRRSAEVLAAGLRERGMRDVRVVERSEA